MEVILTVNFKLENGVSKRRLFIDDMETCVNTGGIHIGNLIVENWYLTTKYFWHLIFNI